MSGVVKSQETESRLVVARFERWGEGMEEWKVTASEFGVSFMGDRL